MARGGAGGGGRALSGLLPAAAPPALRERSAAVRVVEMGSSACGEGRLLFLSRLKMAPPVFPLPLIPVPGREPRGRGGGGGGWRGWAREGGDPPLRAGAPAERYRCLGLARRAVPLGLLVRYGAGGWVVGPSLSLSLASGRRTVN